MPSRASRRGSFKIASFRGIPIYVHFTLLLVLPLLAMLFGGVFSRAALEAEVPPQALVGAPWLWGLVVAVGLFLAVLVHEMAHVLYALGTGGKVRSITLMMLGGVSELTEAPKRPRDEALMALVGPLTSLALAGGLYGVVVLLRDTGSFNLQFTFFYLAMLNLVLGVFNLLPAFPLDGGRVVRALLSARMGPVRGTRAAATLGKVFAALFGVVGLLVFNPFLMLIAVFVYLGAQGEAQQVLLKTTLEGLSIQDVMTPREQGLDPDAPLSECLWVLRRERKLALPVTEAERPVGWVTLEAVQAVEAPERTVRLAREVLEPAAAISPSADAWSAVQRMTEERVPRLVVVDEGGRLVGTVDPNDISQTLALHQKPEARGRGERPRTWSGEHERPA